MRLEHSSDDHFGVFRSVDEIGSNYAHAGIPYRKTNKTSTKQDSDQITDARHG